MKSAPEPKARAKQGSDKSPQFAFFATCAKGLEGLLEQELRDLGAEPVRQTVAGVYFGSPGLGLGLGYKACLWSRLANKVLMPLASLDASNAENLYQGVKAIAWEDYISPSGTLLVDFVGTDRVIKNSQFGALKIKDAVVDRLRDLSGQRPSVAKQRPDVRINARLHRGKVALSLDMSGESLHRRGYRQQQGLAPLKENLAAALLLRAGWPQLLEQARAEGRVEQLSLVDPMCGSGTIVLEAALMATDTAPGIARPAFGFETWLNYQSDEWLALREQAIERRRRGLAQARPRLLGFDQDDKVLAAARANAQRAKLTDWVQFKRQSLEALGEIEGSGLLLSNPPYGERLGELEQLGHLYRELGDKLKEYFSTWRAGVFTGNPQLGKTMGLRASKRYKLFNGALASELLMFEVQADNFVDAPPQNLSPRQELTEGIFFASCTEAELSNGAQMVLNRLRKNIKPLKKWAEQRQIDCYRVYDADMPEYSAAIDYYAGHWHVQEYQAPASVKEDKAQGRLQELVDALVVGFELNPEQIFIKQRRRQSGKAQYEKRGGNRYRDEVSRSKIVVQEGSARFAVNLWDYLDSGVFLDHRPVRKMVGELAAGKRLLNLFCYTGTVTVQAALAGARSSVSVDMSRTYISWCRENFGLNNIHEAKHELVQADCFDYLKQCREAFDVIMLDPPSFSNSKRMDNTLDIQRDHVALLRRCMDLLKPGGVLVFSNNLRSFKLDDEGLAPYAIEDISPRTIDKDFQRRPNIHQCWLLRHQ